MTISYWLAQDDLTVPERHGDGAVDVLVVGAGVTGCSCALTLAEAGVRVRIVEATGVAAGASGRNGGFALRGGTPAYDVARVRLGSEPARALWRLSEDVLGRMEALAGDALRRVGSLRLAVDDAELAALRREHDALVEDGFAARMVEELPAPLEGLYAGGLEHPGDGSLSPARWVRRLATAAVASGAELETGRRVTAVELEGLAAAVGAVVVAVDGWTGELLPELRALAVPRRGQVLVTEPVGEIRFDRPHYARWGYDYWQQLPDGRLVLGGFRDAAVGAESTTEDATTPVVQGLLDAFAERLLGRSVEVTHRWSGAWAETPDLLPLAGRVPGRERIWVAGGYSGHGNVLGLACGDLVARAILGESPPALALFDPGRLDRTR